MKDFLMACLNTLGLAWWVEITTESPQLTYYFGPFSTVEAAKAAQAGYVEDLEQEGAQGIQVQTKRCKPDKLTIAHDAEEQLKLEKMPVLSGRV